MEEFDIGDGGFVGGDRVDCFEGTHVPTSDCVVVGSGGYLMTAIEVENEVKSVT